MNSMWLQDCMCGQWRKDIAIIVVNGGLLQKQERCLDSTYIPETTIVLHVRLGIITCETEFRSYFQICIKEISEKENTGI